MMQLRALAKRCAHGLFRHDTHKGAVVLGVLGNQSPWDRLAALLSNPDLKNWPRDGWILIMVGLVCPQCGYENLPHQSPMVELNQDRTIYCQSCGRITKADPPVETAAGPHP
jgi:hypothetical protein